MKKLLDYDPETGVKEVFHYDHLTGDVRIETTQDVEPLLDQNNALRNDESYSKDGIKNEMWHFASIPLIVQLKWLNKYGAQNDPLKKGNEKLLFSLLNDPEWKYLKTTNKIHLAR